MKLSAVIAAVESSPSATRLAVDVVSAAAGEPERAVLIVPPVTELVVEDAHGGARAGSVAYLTAGARIVARHTGAELRSLSPQHHATRIQVLRDA